MSFRGLLVRAIGFGNDHVKHDGEGFNYHHAHAAMVMTFEAKGCVTWCPKRLQDKDHTSSNRWTKGLWCHQDVCMSLSGKHRIYLNFQKRHEVYNPTNQAARQSEVPTSGYG
jgi:hypothetical protein